MVRIKGVFNDTIKNLVEPDTLYTYLTDYEMPLTEAIVYHLVHDIKQEKSSVADIMGLSVSWVYHAYARGEARALLFRL